MATKRPSDGSAADGRISTIHDVARLAGVSKATVSRALRGLPRVRLDTRERVLRAATELNYVASPTAASLASGKTGVVAVVVPFMARWYFANLISGAEKVLRRSGYHVLLFDLGGVGAARSLVLDEQLLRKRVDGVLVLSLELRESEWELLADLRVPVVTVGAQTERWDCVRIDDVAAATTATEHLLHLGHRRIAHIGGNATLDEISDTPSDRLRGYERVMTREGVAIDPFLVLACDWTVAGGLAAADRLPWGHAAPTAVFAASDEIAMGVMHGARRRGITVPGDLSVVGIDDHELSFIHDLTTVAQPVPEQGGVAGTMLIEALTGPKRSGPRVVTLPTGLVLRGSTAPLAVAPAEPLASLSRATGGARLEA